MKPISYSDFFMKDDSIEELIRSLEEAKATYEKLSASVSKEAKEMKSALTAVNITTQEGQATTEAAADGAKRLAKLQHELAIATSQAGFEIQKYKTVLAEVNKIQSDSAKITISSEGSIKELKARVAELTNAYNSMSGESRLSTSAADDLVETIQRLKTQVKEADDRIKANVKTLTEYDRTLINLRKTKEKLVNAFREETQELFKVKRETDELLKIRKYEEIANNTVRNSYDNLAARYNLAKIELNKYSQEVINSSRYLSNMQENAKLMRAEMIRLQEATGSHTLKVGDYGRAWNGLGVSVQQVFRELPVLAVSWNTFFLAISNNLPILADEIQRVTLANKAAAAEGRNFDSLTKQLGKSIFSMQTVLVLAVTALTLYGGKMVEWIKNTLAGAKAAISFEKALRSTRKAMQEDTSAVANNIVQYKQLREAWGRAAGDAEKQKRIIEDNASAFQSWGISISAVNDANLLFVERSDVVAEALMLQAEAAAAAKLAGAELEKVVKDRIKLAEELEKGPQKKWWMGLSGGSMSAGGSLTAVDVEAEAKMYHDNTVKRLQDNIAKNEEVVKSYFKVSEAAELSRLAKLKEAGLTPWEDRPDDSKGPKGPKDPKGPSDLSIEQANLRIRKEYLESLSELERDEFLRRRQQLLDQYEVEKADLLNKQKNDEKLTQESKDLINEIILNKSEKLAQDMELLNIEEQQRILDFEQEKLNIQLSVTERGSEKFFRLRSELMRNQMQYEVLENRKLLAEKQQDEEAIREKFAYAMLQLEKSLDDEFFKQMQDFQRAEFEALRQSEYNKSKFALEQERARWQRRIDLAKAGLLELSSLELATAEQTITGLDRMLKELKDGRDLFDRLGFNLGHEQKQALSDTVSFVKSQISDIIQVELELAELRLAKANEQVDKSYDLMRLEIEARSQGYANLVETTAQELALAKEAQQQALNQKRAALRAQQALDSIEQVSSLVTASANIWKSFSPLGPIGVASAIASIALMFGSFTGAKLRAFKLTREATETYADGHVELLSGGSHASGKDIYLGQTPGGKERRAEGGEVFAVINKRNTQRYGASRIFDIVNSLNRGEFEDKYLNNFKPNLMVSSSNVEMGDIGSDVKDIKNNTQYQYYKDTDGKIVEKYKNRTRTFK